MNLPPDFPRTAEDALLLDWWQSRGGSGLLLLEVKLGLAGPGDWPNKRSYRSLDGLHLPGAGDDAVVRWTSFDRNRLPGLLRSEPAVILEAKRELNTDVIGQAIAGRDFFSRSYPAHGPLSMVVTVGGPVADSALRWVADRRGIQVHEVAPSGLDQAADSEDRYAQDLLSVLDQIGDDAAAASLLNEYLAEFDGGHFETYGWNNPERITADDLVAVTMLSIGIMRNTRAGITPSHAVALERESQAIGELLEQIPSELKLEDLIDTAYASVLGPDSAAWQLWDALLRIDIPRVARHKLLARKRPALLPVRDSVVERQLNLGDASWRPWWTIMRNDSVRERLDRIRSTAGSDADHLSLLRVADILLWRDGRSR